MLFRSQGGTQWQTALDALSSRLLKKQIYQATPCLSDAFFEVFNMVTALEVCPKALFKLFRHTSPRTYAC